MRRKDLTLIAIICFLSAIIGGVVSRQIFDANVFAKSEKEIVPNTNSKKKGEKAFAGPTTDYIKGIQVIGDPTTTGQVLKYTTGTPGQWGPGTDATGGGGAPDTFIAGDNVLVDITTECNDIQMTYRKVYEIKIANTGTLRIKWDMRSSHDGSYTQYAKVYRNGVAIDATEQTTTDIAYGEKSVDVSGWSVCDLVQLYIKSGHINTTIRCYTKNFRLCVNQKSFNTWDEWCD